VSSQRIWSRYHEAFADLEREGAVRRPVVPEHCEHNAHMYYLLLRDLETRTAFIEHLLTRGVHAVFHYVPLHSSLAGGRYGRGHGPLEVTTDVSDRLVRLPLWADMTESQVDRVIDAVWDFMRTRTSSIETVHELRRTAELA
jgi:dTDP-4-amino-4,6-dideoxygalactose transaminase